MQIGNFIQRIRLVGVVWQQLNDLSINKHIRGSTAGCNIQRPITAWLCCRMTKTSNTGTFPPWLGNGNSTCRDASRPVQLATSGPNRNDCVVIGTHCTNRLSQKWIRGPCYHQGYRTEHHQLASVCPCHIWNVEKNHASLHHIHWTEETTGIPLRLII